MLPFENGDVQPLQRVRIQHQKGPTDFCIYACKYNFVEELLINPSCCKHPGEKGSWSTYLKVCPQKASSGNPRRTWLHGRFGNLNLATSSSWLQTLAKPQWTLYPKQSFQDSDVICGNVSGAGIIFHMLLTHLVKAKPNYSICDHPIAEDLVQPSKRLHISFPWPGSESRLRQRKKQNNWKDDFCLKQRAKLNKWARNSWWFGLHMMRIHDVRNYIIIDM